jgi:hypothetical protein
MKVSVLLSRFSLVIATNHAAHCNVLYTDTFLHVLLNQGFGAMRSYIFQFYACLLGVAVCRRLALNGVFDY